MQNHVAFPQPESPSSHQDLERLLKWKGNFMIRKITVFLAVLLFSLGLAQDGEASFSLQVLVTCSGKSLAGFSTQTLLTREGLETDYGNHAYATEHDGYESLIIVVADKVTG